MAVLFVVLGAVAVEVVGIGMLPLMGRFTRSLLRATARRGAQLLVDTNVFLELYSIHDLLEAEEGNDLSRLASRRERLRNALFFAYRCDQESLRCGVLRHETVRLLQLRVPPESSGLTRQYTAAFVDQIGRTVFPGWKRGFLKDEDDRGLEGMACDDLLLAVAKREGLPVITNERPEGKRPRDREKCLRVKCIDSGVRVFDPGEFWREGGVNPDEAASTILARFQEVPFGSPDEPRAVVDGRRMVLDLVEERWEGALRMQ